MKTRPKQPNAAETNWIAEGIRAFEDSRLDEALGHFKRALGSPAAMADAWFWMGRIREEQGDRAAAGLCYYLSCDTGVDCRRARAALKRLKFYVEEAS